MGSSQPVREPCPVRLRSGHVRAAQAPSRGGGLIGLADQPIIGVMLQRRRLSCSSARRRISHPPMESLIARALRMQLSPVALCWSDQRPSECVQFQQGRWGCVIWHLSAAAKGRIAAVDETTFGCLGGATGLGFGNAYLQWPGGIECFHGFLSTGYVPPQGEADSIHARRAARHVDGERYIKSPALVRAYVDRLPMMRIPTRYVLFKPLSAVDPSADAPQVVVFVVDPDQLSALIVLANYDRDSNDNVIAPFAAGCQQIGILAYQEGRSERPRVVLGLSDLSARRYVKRQLGEDLMTMAIPWKRFLEMESNVEGSFLQAETWRELID